MKLLQLLLLASLALAGCDQLNKPSTSDGTKKDVDRDNSAVNIRDRDSDLKTPMDQGQGKSDINITASIRKGVMNSQMSTNAQNVKIITMDGLVTLRGPVKNQQEKTQVEEIARSVAGVKTLDNQLEVEKTP